MTLSRSQQPLALAELERRSPHSKSLIYRVLQELQRVDFVTRDEHARYGLGLSAFEVGAAYVAMIPLQEAVQGVLKNLATNSGEATNLGVLRGGEVVYLMKFDGASTYVTISRVGGRVPATCVAIGKALLAELPESAVREVVPDPLVIMTPKSHKSIDTLEADLRTCRAHDYATDSEEAVMGRAGLAVSIPYPADVSGRAAISMSTSARDVDGQRGAELLGLLDEARSRIKREFAARSSWPVDEAIRH